MNNVPCACPACNGRLVTKYIRRNHMRAFVAVNVNVAHPGGEEETEIGNVNNLEKSFDHNEIS